MRIILLATEFVTLLTYLKSITMENQLDNRQPRDTTTVTPPHGYQHNRQYFKHDNQNVSNGNRPIYRYAQNTFTKYQNTNDAHNVLLMKVGSSINATNGLDSTTWNRNIINNNNKIDDVTITNRYEYLWNINDKSTNKSSKYTSHSLQHGHYDNNGHQVVKICENGRTSGWIPSSGNQQYIRNSFSNNRNQYFNGSTENTSLVRLKSYTNYENVQGIHAKQRLPNIRNIQNNQTQNGMALNKTNNNRYITSKTYSPQNGYRNNQRFIGNSNYPHKTNLYQTNHDANNVIIRQNNQVRHGAIGRYTGKPIRDSPEYLEGRRSHPEVSYRSDYHDSWQPNFAEEYDLNGWNYLKDLHYCNKYCHCCKKHERFHISYGALDKVLYFLKYFGFNAGRDFFYGRSIDDYNPLIYLKNLYRRFSYPDYEEYKDYDESFEHFDEDHGEPDDVIECPDLCSCCHPEIIVKLKKKLHGFRWEKHHKKTLRGLLGIVKHLMISGEEECPDCDDDESGWDQDRHEYQDSYQPFHEGNQELHEYPPHNLIQHHDHAVSDHHHQSFLFDCSKCCRFCKKATIKVVKGRGKKKRKKRRKKLRGKILMKFLKHLSRGKFSSDYDDDDDDDDDDNGSDDNQGQQGSSNTTCCNDFKGIKVVIVVIAVAVIVVQGFSSINMMIVVIIPMIFFGMIIIFIFLLLQAIIPMYFVPIIAIILMLIVAPLLLLALMFLMLLPLTLLPIFLPFILRLNNATAYNLPNITCTTQLPINCTIGTAPVYTDEITEEFASTTVIVETATDITLTDSQVDTTEPVKTEEREIKLQDSFYWKVNSALGLGYCLERVGCHFAAYTHSFDFYNRFILRILQNLSLSIRDSKFAAYKDAFQIGSLKESEHLKCATLYYCKPLDYLMFKK